MSEENEQQFPIPDFVVRQVGALQLQLAAANEQINALREKLAALNATKPEPEPALDD